MCTRERFGVTVEVILFEYDRHLKFTRTNETLPTILCGTFVYMWFIGSILEQKRAGAQCQRGNTSRNGSDGRQLFGRSGRAAKNSNGRQLVGRSGRDAKNRYRWVAALLSQ